MFSNEIDVAEIMREIKRKAAPFKVQLEGKAGDFDNISASLNEICAELVRINDFIENTRASAEMFSEPGKVIPISDSRSGVMRKLLIIFKRLVRKSTRYLFLDQKAHNEKMEACIKALSESQKLVIRLTHVVASLYEERRNWNSIEDRLDEMENCLQLAEQKIVDINKHIYGQSLNDLHYVDFENEYRGSEEEIKKRLMFYMNNYVKQIIRDKSNEVVVDVGCGRGEWLELLRDGGYKAQGVDSNSSMVKICEAKKLKVEQADALEFLKSLGDNSIKIITGFQIAEHIPLTKLFQLIKEAYRVLTYHGVLILETPNCKNIEVGAASFYIDPTHIRPLHPEYMKFLANKCGFYETNIAVWKQQQIQDWLDSLVNGDSTSVLDSTVVRTMFESMKQNFYTSPDYALIATK